LKFGIFGGATARGAQPGAPPPGAAASPRIAVSYSDDSHGYQEFVQSVVEAEALGFYSLFLVEHHFTGVAQVSASLNLLTFLAARTSTIRLGTAVVVVPWHNPVLLSEQAATLDVLSNGRFDFGVGKGYRPKEFEGFCIPIDEASERFEEAMELVRKSLTSDTRFSHHSKRWHFDDIIVEPPPIQKPHPPLWLAAGRPESIRKAAADGYCLLLDQFATFEVTLERFHTYRDAVEDSGREFDPMTVGVARGLQIVRSADERAEAVERRMRSLGRMNQHAASADGSYVSSMASDPDLLKAAEQGTLIGTPDEIVERIRQLRNGGVEYILLSGTGNASDVLKTFSEEVMPAFA
jgi:alkanesulfonate monooxygenase SsuD/methylene tetrahydromethanopterin reductase-like flavin-dependent oxidoreductase (luciferase family)